jgi:hypothetical protein
LVDRSLRRAHTSHQGYGSIHRIYTSLENREKRLKENGPIEAGTISFNGYGSHLKGNGTMIYGWYPTTWITITLVGI